MPLPDKFKLLRGRENNISQRELADILDIPKSTIGHLETGKIAVISTEVFNKFVEHDELSKYAFWLLKDDIGDETMKAMLAFRGTDQETDEPTPDDQPD